MEEILHYGRVIFFKNTYGFIKETDVNGKDLKLDHFFHFSELEDCDGFKTILPNTKVSFFIGKNIRNQDCAKRINKYE